MRVEQVAIWIVQPNPRVELICTGQSANPQEDVVSRVCVEGPNVQVSWDYRAVVITTACQQTALLRDREASGENAKVQSVSSRAVETIGKVAGVIYADSERAVVRCLPVDLGSRRG